MIYQEAIKQLEDLIENSKSFSEDDDNIWANDVKALKMAIEALEKQIPKKPNYYGDDDDGKILCPYCETDLYDDRECLFDNCPYCGQALDWGEEGEEC